MLTYLATADVGPAAPQRELDAERRPMVSPEPVRLEAAQLDAHPAVAALSAVGRGWSAPVGSRSSYQPARSRRSGGRRTVDFYLVLAGRLGVDVGGETVRTLGPASSSASSPRATGGPASATRGSPR